MPVAVLGDFRPTATIGAVFVAHCLVVAGYCCLHSRIIPHHEPHISINHHSIIIDHCKSWSTSSSRSPTIIIPMLSTALTRLRRWPVGKLQQHPASETAQQSPGFAAACDALKRSKAQPACARAPLWVAAVDPLWNLLSFICIQKIEVMQRTCV